MISNTSNTELLLTNIEDGLTYIKMAFFSKKVILKKLSLKKVTVDTVPLDSVNYHFLVYYIGEWNPSTSSVDFSGPTFYSGFTIGFPGGFELLEDDYTWEVTTSEDVVVKEPISYPGKKELPLVNSATMTSEWLVDDSLKLSWTNPANNSPGDYDEVVVYSRFGCGRDAICLPSFR